MAARLLEGKPVADAVLKKVSEQVTALSKLGVAPGLGTILVGDNEASSGYVRKKHEACHRVGHCIVQRGDSRQRHPGRPARCR